MKLSVIVPVYNEEKTIHSMLQRLLKIVAVKEVVVINDGSTDRTRIVINQFAKKHSRKIKVFHKKNGGKGSAVHLGLKKVSGDYVLIQDADLEYDPRDIKDLIKPVIEKKAVVVYGSRFLGPHNTLLYWHWVGNQFLNFLTNILYNTTLSDLETCYKLIPTKLLRELQIESNDFSLEPEITCKILKRNIKIYETPISYTGRDFSEGKKISWKDGFGAMWVILKLRFLD
jgi:glycosyltransferase involved in cell wall biosynthesis